MPYMEQMQSTVSYLATAGEAGRKSLDGMMGPVNGAISEMTGAASELETLPVIGPMIGEKLQRVMRGVSTAQAKVGRVVAVYSQATRAASQIEQRLEVFGEQAPRAKNAINQIAGKINPALGNILPTSIFATDTTPAVEAVKPFPHLLIMQPHKHEAPPYYFNLDTAAFDELSRQSSFRWASQERLTRRPAQQSVGMGEEKMTLKGSIFPGHRGGLKQLDTLRSIGGLLLPIGLTTGYGHVLGDWCLTSISEDQSALLQGGIPRKQGFSLEFVCYGEDLQNT